MSKRESCVRLHFRTRSEIENFKFLQFICVCSVEMESCNADKKDGRISLAERLDEQLDEYVDSLLNKEYKYKDGFSEANWEEEMENHPAFMTRQLKEGEDVPELVSALQALKYEDEDDTPEAQATEYKNEGNHNFKMKKYRWAIDNYTEGIKKQCRDIELNAVLYTNRAASHWYLGNYRHSFKDVIVARKFKSDHFKAIVRGALCCLKLKLPDEAVTWCDSGLSVKPNEAQLLEIRQKALTLKKESERDKRKEIVKKRKQKRHEDRLIAAIKDRGIRIAHLTDKETQQAIDSEADASNYSMLVALETHHPTGVKVHQDEGGNLHWPVMFMYPEYKEVDLIESFHEKSRFIDHLNEMFRENAEVPWDRERKYIPDKLSIYFEDRSTEDLIPVESSHTLGATLKHKKYTVYNGTPTFILLVEGSAFQQEFLKLFKK